MNEDDLKVVIAVKALLRGYVVPIEGYRYRLDDENNLCIELRRYNNETKDLMPWDGLLGIADHSVGHFFRECKKITKEDANSLVTQMTLERTKVKRV